MPDVGVMLLRVVESREQDSPYTYLPKPGSVNIANIPKGRYGNLPRALLNTYMGLGGISGDVITDDQLPKEHP